MSLEREIIIQADRYGAAHKLLWPSGGITDAYIAGYLDGLEYAHRALISQNPRQDSEKIFKTFLAAIRVETCSRCNSIRHHVADCDTEY